MLFALSGSIKCHIPGSFTLGSGSVLGMDYLSTPLLEKNDVVTLVDLLSRDPTLWRDGSLTAGEFASAVKQNKQLDPKSSEAMSGVDFVTKRLVASPLVKSFSLVKRVHSVMFSKCEEGDGYGWHVDNPFSKHGRRDLSFTIFLSDLDHYQGGDLSIQSSQDSHDVRLPPGHIFLYPSTALHCVRPIAQGTRLACVGWIESYVRSSEDRLLLFNLEAGARSLLAKHGRSDELDLIYQSYVNAVRRLSG